MTDNRIRAQKLGMFQQWIGLYIYQELGEHKMGFAKQIEFEELDEGIQQYPTTTLDIKNAQSLMDDLWECGLRPSEGSGSAGAMAATQKHLEDMRKIAFKYIEK